MIRTLLLLSIVLTTPATFASSLLGYWNFNNGIIDVSPNSTYTMGNNVALASSPFTNAGVFDGLTSYAVVSDSQALQLGDGSFSISVWVKPEVSDGIKTIIAKQDANGPGFQFNIDSDSATGWTINASITDGQGNIVSCVNCGSVNTFGQWFHLALVYDVNDLRLYVDGTLDATITGQTLDTINATADLIVGAVNTNENASSQSFDGEIDELKLLDNVLSSEGVQRETDVINQSIVISRVGPVSLTTSQGNNYQRDTVYFAETDLYVTYRFSGSGCNTNLSLLRVGNSASNLATVVGRVTGYNSASTMVAKGEYWEVDHYKKYSSCNVFITTRTLN